MSVYDIPLSSEDLRGIADTIDELNGFFVDSPRGIYKEPIQTKVGQITIEIYRPDTDDVIGYAAFDDAWIGFKPVQQ